MKQPAEELQSTFTISPETQFPVGTLLTLHGSETQYRVTSVRAGHSVTIRNLYWYERWWFKFKYQINRLYSRFLKALRRNVP